MLGLVKVAVTGGLSCGKSSVCRILQELGARAISADAIVHQLLSSDKDIVQRVVALLGTAILDEGKINRKRVGALVFSDPPLLAALEAIMHPAVYAEIEKEVVREEQSKSVNRLFVVEVPLLFESGREKDFDCVVTVASHPNLCFQRFAEKQAGDFEEFKRRSSLQMSLLDKARRADYVIVNSRDMSHLVEIVTDLHRELIENIPTLT